MAGVDILFDDQNEMLGISLVDDMGQPVGSLPPGVGVSWAIKTDPNPAPSVTLTPSADTMNCKIQATGILAKGVVISAMAILPPATVATEADETFDIDPSAAVGFRITVSTPVHN